MNELLETIKAICPDDEFWNCIGRSFDLMEIAEDEITKAQRQYPEAKDAIWRSFRLLVPGYLSDYPEALYRTHCQEILKRVAHGVDTRPGTKAEILVGLSQWSLEHKPDTVTAALMGKLFAEIFPERADYSEGLVQIAELTAPADAVPELYAKLQHKAERHDRTLRERR